MTSVAHDLGMRQTEAVINQDKSLVPFQRFKSNKTTAGGVRREALGPTAPQEVRLIPRQALANQTPLRRTPDGEMVTPTWFILAMPGSDIQRFDEVEIKGHSLRVLHVNTEPDWLLLAEAIEVG